MPPVTLSYVGLPTDNWTTVDTFKWLEIHISNELKWEKHAVTSKVASRLYFLKQLKRSGARSNDLLCFYNTVLRPVLDYASPVWHSSLTVGQTEALESMQKRAMRWWELYFRTWITMAPSSLLILIHWKTAEKYLPADFSSAAFCQSHRASTTYCRKGVLQKSSVDCVNQTTTNTVIHELKNLLWDDSFHIVSITTLRDTLWHYESFIECFIVLYCPITRRR